MGAPSLTLLHNLTDGLAAMLRKDLDGFEAEYGAKTNTTLWDFVDGSGDPAVEAALGLAAYTADRQSLPGNHRYSLDTLLARSGYRGVVSALDALVRSADGGSYATLGAYLTAVGAVVHPLAGELFRNVLGEAVFGTNPIATCFAPAYQSLAPAHAYAGADGALADVTTAAGNATTADLTLWASNGHSLYLQAKRPFNQFVLGLSTLGSVTINPLVEYVSGAGWTSVSGLTDNSVGFTKNQPVKFTLPTDWVPSYLDKGGTAFPGGKERLYTLRIQRQASTLATPPVGTCVRLIPTPILNAAGLHLGIGPQPPLAICRITGTNAIAVDVLYAPDVSRFKAPGIRLEALTPFSANLTPTVSYTNQAGANQTQAQSAWTAPAALDTVGVTLNGADTGVEAILGTGWAVTTAATDGCFAVYVQELRTPAI